MGSDTTRQDEALGESLEQVRVDEREAARIREERDTTPPSDTDRILAALGGISAKVDTLAERVEAVEEIAAQAALGVDLTQAQREARARLENDTGQPGPVEPEPERELVQLADGMYAELPAPSPEAKAAWERSARTIMENIDVGKWAMSVDDAIEAYAKGGPLWLAAAGTVAHDHLMGLPYAMRQDMVRSVHVYSPPEAALLARDILRASTDDQQGAGYDRALERSDDRLRGVVPQVPADHR